MLSDGAPYVSRRCIAMQIKAELMKVTKENVVSQSEISRKILREKSNKRGLFSARRV